MREQVSPSDIRAARERIAGGVVVTPCPPALGLAGLLPGRPHLKLETHWEEL